MSKPRISVIKRYAKSDAVTWEDVNLNERDVLVPLVRIALAAKALRDLEQEGLLAAIVGAVHAKSDVLRPYDDEKYALRLMDARQKEADALDAIDWDD